MNRRTCESFDLIRDALNCQTDDAKAKAAGFRTIHYDARGHGDSSGWELASDRLEQFHRKNLGIDMLFVANHYQSATAREHGALLGGYSMGASSALWAAY